jgi:imidazolonepropionase-like amidohydrolase
VLYHCTWADEEAVDLLEAHRHELFVAPSPGINWANCYEGEAYGITREAAVEQEQFETLERVSKIMPLLRKRGVRVLPGGDYGFPWNPIGRNARDLELFVKLFGLSPAETLMAATKEGGELMDMKLGLVKEGYLADLLLVDGDPLGDIGILQDRERLLMIMQDGRLHKAPPLLQQRVRRVAARRTG